MSYLNRYRRTGYDVTNRVDVTNAAAVSEEVCAMMKGLYPDAKPAVVERAFRDCNRLYRGQYPEYRACEMPYHNLQHVLDVSLAVARLLDGHEKQQAEEKDRLGADHFQICILAALFHDSGYIRRLDDSTARHGAEYADHHVARGNKFVEGYLTKNKLDSWIPLAKRLILYTEYEVQIESLAFEDSRHTTMGYILGTADVIAQMADRVYLEKCRDYLYKELEISGLLDKTPQAQNPADAREPAFITPDEFLEQTPGRIQQTMRDRLQNSFHSVYKYAAVHFNGPNLYLDAMGANFNHLNRLIESKIIHTLNRKKEGESDSWS